MGYTIFKQVGIFALPSWALMLISTQYCPPLGVPLSAFSIASIITTIWLFYGLWRSLSIQQPKECEGREIKILHIIIFLATLALSTIAFSHKTGIRHDYYWYAKQWEVVLAGADPWLKANNTLNAYGPIHNFFAWIYQAGQMLPKYLFSFLLVATGIISAFIPLGIKDKTTLSQRCCLFTLLVLSPFSLITVGLHGNNDVIPAAAMVLSLIGIVTLRSTRSRFLSGGILAIGCMCKYYPLIILPSLLVRHRRIDWSFASGFFGTLSLITALTYKLWGESFITPLLFAGSRGSKQLSVFSFSSEVIGINLDKLSIPLMLIVFVAISYFLFTRNAGPILGSIITFASVLSFYKVGHPQFFLFFFLVTPFAIRYFFSCSNPPSQKLMATFFVWIGFLNFYQLEFLLTCEMKNQIARALLPWGGLFYGIISGLLALIILREISISSLLANPHEPFE